MFGQHTKGLIAAILLGTVSAAGGLFFRYFNGDFSILQQGYMRLGAALIIGLLVFPKALGIGRLGSLSVSERWLLVGRSVGFYVVAVSLFTWATIHAKFSNVTFIRSLPASAIWGFILLREKITPKKVGLIAVSFIGVVLISVKEYSSLSAWGMGELAALIGVLIAGASLATRRWHSRIFNDQEITYTTLCISTAVLLVVSLLHGEGLPSAHWNFKFIIAIFTAGAFELATLWLINYSFGKLEAVIVANLMTLEVIFGVIFGFLFYREFPSVKEWFGGALIVLSVYLMNKLNSHEGSGGFVRGHSNAPRSGQKEKIMKYNIIN